MLEFVGICLSVAFGIALIAAVLVRKLAPRFGLVDQPGHRKVHHTPTAMGGGIAVWLGIVVTVVFLFLLGPHFFADSFQQVQSEISGSEELPSQLIAVLIGATVLFVVGLIDDRFNLPWKPRLLLQLLVACGVVAAGVRATFFVSQPAVGFVVTVLWIMVLTNAMNFLDNMDALSAGIGVIAASMSAAILLLMSSQPSWAVSGLLLLLAGSLTGFLCLNRPPASIFMGDSGSNLIGFLLATLTIVGTFFSSTDHRHVILAPLCVLAIPLYDFCSVILIRLREGRSPFHGDKSHFSHRLVEIGFRPARAVLTIHLATLMTGLGGLLLYKVSDWTGALLVVSLICSVISLVAILESAGRRAARHRDENGYRSQTPGQQTVENDPAPGLEMGQTTPTEESGVIR